jgi:threonine/homoserine/homoserine lactone efflux protein
MIEALLGGLLFGLIVTILIGPVFFALLQTSLDKGFRPGVQMALGIALSDSLYILLVYFGLSKLIGEANLDGGLGFAGGAIMLIFGFVTIFKQGKKVEIKKDTGSSRDALVQVSKGFFLNGINPFILLFWGGAVSKVLLRTDYEGIHHLIFFATTILTIFSTDVLKVYLSGKISRFLTPAFLTWLNRLSGGVLIIFGCRLLYMAYKAL